jgi:hypothetical protein
MMGLITITLGTPLTWDQEKGLFPGDNAANAMLCRPFREKWIDSNVIDWMNKYQEIKFT